MKRTTEAMEAAIGAYFAACDATRERRELKNGGVEEIICPQLIKGQYFEFQEICCADLIVFIQIFY